MDSSRPGFPVHHRPLELAQIHVHRVSDAIQPSHPLSSPLLPPSIFVSIRGFSNESAPHIRWSKYWSFHFNISPSNEYSGLIYFKNELVWYHSSPKDSEESSPTPQFKGINSLVFSFLYDPTLTSIHDYGKNHSFDYTDFCQQSMSLLFNMLSRLVIAFLPKRKPLLISWLQSPSAVILEPKGIKSVTVFIASLSILHVVMGLDDLGFTHIEFF